MRRSSGVLVALMLFAAPVTAAGQLAVMPKIGTAGVGADVAFGASDWIVLRAGGSFFPYDPEFTVSDIDWEVRLPSNGLVALDVHLGGTGFRVSGGAFLLVDDVLFEAVLSETVTIRGQDYEPDEVGLLEATVEYERLSPFLSVGFGRAAARGVGLFIELGAALIGDPTVTIEQSGGSLSGFEQILLNENVKELEDDAREDLEDANLYPILNIGVRIGI